MMVEIKSARRKTHAVGLGLLRRATLARILDVRKNRVACEIGMQANAPQVDRTAKILEKLGKGIGLTTADAIHELQLEFEQTVQLASSNDTFHILLLDFS